MSFSTPSEQDHSENAPAKGFKRLVPLLLVIVAASMVIGYAWMGWGIMQSQPDFSESYTADGTTQQSLTFPDGSTMQLQGFASVSYSAKVRKVILLSGQATLTVADNPVPFNVIAGKARIIGDGATFMVNNRRTEKTFEPVDVTVSNGTVQVQRDSVWLWQTQTPVQAGQTVQVDAEGNVGNVAVVGK
jgi:ferric-dicitrate binding protein FerR (iron transport regulator)